MEISTGNAFNCGDLENKGSLNQIMTKNFALSIFEIFEDFYPAPEPLDAENPTTYVFRSQFGVVNFYAIFRVFFRSCKYAHLIAL